MPNVEGKGGRCVLLSKFILILLLLLSFGKSEIDDF